MKPLRRGSVGVVEDDATLGDSLAHRLEIEGYEVHLWRTGRDAVTGLKSFRPDFVICDIRLPDISGEEVFLKSVASVRQAPFLFVTAYGEIEQAVRLTKAGAQDYIVKPYDLGDLLERIADLCNLHRIFRPEGILGVSDPMMRIEILLRRVADIESTLLFLGESGVGKEVAAQFTHRQSKQSDQPFMAVNCAAIPADLIESELFGHEKGSFTGAQLRHEGYVERAKSGVLFLDEVSELPLLVQSKLLRLVQEHSYSRVGGEEVLKSRARIMCAANVDLELAVRTNRFRKDLYYRINTIQVTIPPLREREADVMALATQFLEFFAQSLNRNIVGFTPSARAALQSHAWPGNVRELRNRVERAVALSNGTHLDVADLFPPQIPDDLGTTEIPSLSAVRDLAERHHIQTCLSRAEGRPGRAAEILGISRSTLFEKMRKLGIRAELRE